MARKNHHPENTPAPETETQDVPTQETATEAPQSAQVKLTPVKKITVATVFGKIAVKLLPPLAVNISDSNPEGDPNPNPELLLCRIAGYASGIKTGTTQYGEWSAVTGDFAATNMQTGEMFMSNTAIVPGAMGDAIVRTIAEKLGEDASAKLAFSCDIGIKRSTRNPAEKYEYVVRPVIKTEFQSPAMALLSPPEAPLRLAA